MKRRAFGWGCPRPAAAGALYSASGEASGFGGDGLVTADFGVPAIAHAVAGPSDVLAVGEAGGNLAAAVFDGIGQPQLSFGRSGRLVVPLVGQSVGEAVTDSGLVAGWVVRNGHRDPTWINFSPRHSRSSARILLVDSLVAA